MKKNTIRVKEPNRKLLDTELNIWVKSLPAAKKAIFYDKVFCNDLLWLHLDYQERKQRFNNYRYRGISSPLYINMLLIYISALYVDPDLKIQKIFPDVEQEYVNVLLPLLIQKSLETNNFNRKNVKDKAKLYY